MSASAQPLPVEAPPLSQAARVLNAFVDPPKTFTDIRRKASWFVPWLLMAIFSYALVAVAAQKIGFAQITQNSMRMRPKAAERLESLPADQRERAMATSTTITKVFSYAAPFVLLLVAVIIGAVLMGTFNFALGAEVKFGQALAVVMYAYLPALVKSVLVIVSIYAGASPEGFQIQNPVASNLAAFVDVSQHPALYVLGQSVDVFSLWITALVGIGFACVARVKRSSALGVVFGWYILVTLVSAGVTALFA